MMLKLSGEERMREGERGKKRRKKRWREGGREGGGVRRRERVKRGGGRTSASFLVGCHKEKSFVEERSKGESPREGQRP